MKTTIVVALATYITLLAFGAGGCRLNHPVPCDPASQWPDPCTEGVVEKPSKDASAER